jgi:threonine synthase
MAPHLALLERYRDLLAVGGEAFPITLGEGGTPLLHAKRLGSELGLDALYLKVEGANPTGSFKDRGMVLAVNRALASGARLVLVSGNFDQALAAVRELGEAGGVVVVNSVNPDRIAGQQTGAFEVVDELGRAPDAVALPVGNAGNITAWWAGFVRYSASGRTDGRRPRMLGIQAEGAAPIVLGKPFEEPETAATAIRIGNPASWQGAVAARDESGGVIEAVSDEEILAMQLRIARLEGIFCEPASAAGVAGVARLTREGRVRADETVVCVLTGHGLKDPDIVTGAQVAEPIAADAASLRQAMQV